MSSKEEGPLTFESSIKVNLCLLVYHNIKERVDRAWIKPRDTAMHFSPGTLGLGLQIHD